MKQEREHYGLSTAITMIVGIVVGSGIFFKNHVILKYTGGNIGLGVIVLCVGAFSIIFGSLTLTELSVRTEKNGGAIGYFEDFISPKIASGFGWFQMFIYFPTLNAVISWVAGIYICSLLGLESTLMNQVMIGYGIMCLFYLVNILSIKTAGYFQNITTFIKMIPLLGIPILCFLANPQTIEIPSEIKLVSVSNVGWGWLAALAPIAFSYDGWIVATSITNEVKKPKKNMPIALTIGPLIVLGVYVFYFLGLSRMLGPEYIMSVGNDAVNKTAEIFFGNRGSGILLLFIVISICGVLNGLVLGSIRIPQALADKKMIPFSQDIKNVNPKIRLSLGSCMVSFIVSSVWMVIHYISQRNGLIGNGDISEIAIVFSYVCYGLLYVKVIQMKRKGEIKSFFKGIICPVFGLIGSSIILIGGILSNPSYVIRFILFCFLICFFGILFYRQRQNNQ